MTGNDRDNTEFSMKILSICHILFRKGINLCRWKTGSTFYPTFTLLPDTRQQSETARVTDIRMELDEEMKEQLNVKLQKIVSEPGRESTCIYYVPDGRKSGGSYKTKIGIVKKIDEYQKILVLEDGCRIPLEDISEIE